MYTLVLIVKAAAVASLFILAWAVWGGRATRRDPDAAPVEGAPSDPVGARVMQGFTAMFIVGVVAMFAITLMDFASHL